MNKDYFIGVEMWLFDWPTTVIVSPMWLIAALKSF